MQSFASSDNPVFSESVPKEALYQMRQIEFSRTPTKIHQHEMMNYTNFKVDWRKNKMAARGQHIQELVILAATLCCNNLTISWKGKLTLNIYIVL